MATCYSDRSAIDLMTARQIASVLQMRVSTVEEGCPARSLPSVKFGRHRCLIHSQVEETVASLPGSPVPATLASARGLAAELGG
jgi:excisionase family DNA binding protein